MLYLHVLTLMVHTMILPTSCINAGLLVWPAAQFINFRAVAPEMRLLFMNAVSLFWGVYLSSQGQKRADAASPPEDGRTGAAMDAAKARL